MTAVVDASARAAATDPTASFCVSAPAGSGKTELLIQRYLALLTRVQRPEQVLAITFTRKAAAEMRERIITALRLARTSAAGNSPHEKMTQTLAQQVLAVDAREGWQLERDIARFNIRTIDSLCAALTRQMPVLSQFGGYADVVDDAAALYTEAVLETFSLLGQNHDLTADLGALMLHFDNNWERLQSLLVSLLKRREQWRGYIGLQHSAAESGALLLAAVQSIVHEALHRLACMLVPYQSELLDLLQFSASNLAQTAPPVFPGTTAADLITWRRMHTLLLTQSGQWRKSLSKRQGFPADKGKAARYKRRMQHILAELQQISGLKEALSALQLLPMPENNSSSWQLALHVSRILPMLAAQLLLVFQRQGTVDHSHITQSALLALGDDDAPTELALRLDYQIEHILVDEFQDTAINQYELLHKLTRGWGEHNAQNPRRPRTILVVGDAMQSIYGFRGGNVGLFLKAQREGFNGVKLNNIYLQCNFRSDQGVVDWVNTTFSQAFAAGDDSDHAQVRFSAAVPMRPAKTTPPVTLHGFSGERAREQEIHYICEQIAARVHVASDTIAVLGRSRTQLQLIVERLRQLRLSCYAPDMDSLARSPVVADLLTLCSALANDADRLAWFALLRAPWCGLQLSDLLLLAEIEGHPSARSIWCTLQSKELHDRLSDDGRTRLAYIVGPLKEAQHKRDRLSLRIWIEQTWVALGGPQCVQDNNGLQDAERFFQLLEQAEMEGLGFDVTWLSSQLDKCYMNGGDPDSQIQLMTLHKAKGLEFDCVILSQLDRVTGRDKRDILLWDEHNNANGDRTFLLAADDHSKPGEPTLYNYLGAQQRKKRELETTRLLYVGATRAVKEILLSCCFTSDKTNGMPRAPSRHSLLSAIWPTFQQQMMAHTPQSIPAAAPLATMRPLRRLKRRHQAVMAPEPVLQQTINTTPLVQDNHTERCAGTVVHQALEQLALRSPLPDTVAAQDQVRWRAALQRQGVWGAALERAEAILLRSVTQTLRTGGKGRWLLSSAHREAHSEWALAAVDGAGEAYHMTIDRCFIDAQTGTRWIIDYKTSEPRTGEEPADFFKRESMAYQAQLQAYRDTLRQHCHEALCCALFFTALGHLQILPHLSVPARSAN